MSGQVRTRAGAVAAGSAVLMALTAVLATVLVGVVGTEPAAAQCAPYLSVSRTDGLAAGGETITVSGSCFDENKGIYVAFCVVPPPGAAPSPCGGGIDMSGAGGLSHWISSNPPPNGVGLAAPYGPGGSFTVTMRPSAALNASIDCRRVSCAVVTRNDHTRTSDRSQDVIVPVTFAADPVPTTAPPVVAPPPTEAPTTTTAPEETTTTTAAPEETSTTTTTAAPPTTADDEVEELAATTASSSSGGGRGTSSGLVAVIAVVVVLVLAMGLVAVVGIGGVGGWLGPRRLRASSDASSAGGAPEGSPTPGGAEGSGGAE